MNESTASSTAHSAPDGASEDQAGPLFWASMIVGAAIAIYGAVELFFAPANGLGSFIPWFAGGALLLDLAIVPVAAGIGLLGRKALPPWAWPPVRAALLASATLIAFAAPLIRGYNASPDNATVQPRNYATGLLSALIVVWVVAAIVLAVVAVSGRVRRTTT